jgi:hypothetical protein
MSMSPSSPRPIVNCPVCDQALRAVGRLPVRRDAALAGIITLSTPGDGQPAVPIDLYRCGSCGRLELYDHDLLLPAL